MCTYRIAAALLLTYPSVQSISGPSDDIIIPFLLLSVDGCRDCGGERERSQKPHVRIPQTASNIMCAPPLSGKKVVDAYIETDTKIFTYINQE